MWLKMRKTLNWPKTSSLLDMILMVTLMICINTQQKKTLFSENALVMTLATLMYLLLQNLNDAHTVNISSNLLIGLTLRSKIKIYPL